MIKSTKDMDILQEDLHSMANWSDDWLLKFHPDKLKKLTITRKNNAGERTYFVGTTTDKVQESTCEEDLALGIKADHMLNYENHRKEKIKKATGMMGAIRRSFRYLNCDTFKLLYKSLV